VTLPLIYALEKASPEERRDVEKVLSDGNYSGVPFGRILDLIERHQGVERARRRAAFFTARAREIIGQFPDSPQQRAMLTITELVTRRDH
jgi:octaprenyl-diphosphate synthase